ncbi:hypothetical protein [Campylobacter vicugnae]|uniref:hypothetical protein n=1 Tax=Campylobacter vicugnae TaxID=1660076 RepID=UPI00254EF780|nr:hypothetical protein [Campylobacter ovis]MDL0105234.1 hypothetical protein [Campylobacter ovis]MDL0106653.1 hypothetical protein [Campylobacter ovis]
MARLEVSRIKPRRIRDLISQAPEARVVAAPVDRSFTRADYSPSGDAKAIALLGDLLGNAARLGERITNDNNKILQEQGRRDALNSVYENGLDKAIDGEGYDHESAKNSKETTLSIFGLYSDKAYKKGFGGMVDEINAKKALSAAAAEVAAAGNYVDSPDPAEMTRQTYARHISEHFPKGDIQAPYRDLDEQGKPIIYKGASDMLATGMGDALAKTQKARVERARQQKTQIEGEYIRTKIEGRPTKELNSNNLTALVNDVHQQGGGEESKIAVTHLVYDNMEQSFNALIEQNRFDEAEDIIENLGNMDIDGIAAINLITSSGEGQQEKYGFRDRLGAMEAQLIKAKQALADKRDKTNEDAAFNILSGLIAQRVKTKDPAAKKEIENTYNATFDKFDKQGLITGEQKLKLVTTYEAATDKEVPSNKDILEVIKRASIHNPNDAVEMLYNAYMQGEINSSDYDTHLKNLLSTDYLTAKDNLIKDYPKPSLLGDEGQKELEDRAITALNREVKLFISENGRRPTEAEYIRIVDSIVEKAHKSQKAYDDYATNKKAEADKKLNTKGNLKETFTNK